jgi:hypothetical protein
METQNWELGWRKCAIERLSAGLVELFANEGVPLPDYVREEGTPAGDWPRAIGRHWMRCHTVGG